MSEQSPRMEWTFPSREDDPWWDAFNDFVRAVDGSGFAHREDRSIIWSGGGTISWDLGTETFGWTGAINVYSPMSAKLLQIEPGTVADWADGEIVYISVTRLALANVVKAFVKASALPSNDDAMAFGVRIGDTIFLRTGISLGDGDTAAGVAPVPGGGVAVEDEGVSVDPATTILDFVGAGVTATQTAAGEVEVNIPGGAADKHTARYIVGNALAGDTLAECHYLDPGDGSGIEAALAAAAITQGDVWIRPGTYDLGIGGTPTERLDIPANVTVRGAGRDHVTIRTATGLDEGHHAFSLDNYSVLMDVGIFCVEPVAYPEFPSLTSYIVDCLGYGALVQRVKIEFDNYWATMPDPYYAENTYGAFGCSGSLTSPPNDANRFVDDEVFKAPYSTVNQMQLLEHDSSGGGLCQVDRFYGEGGTGGINLRASGHVVNSVVENDLWFFWDGITVNSADYCVIVGNRVIGRFDGGNGSKAYIVQSSDGVVLSNNFAIASLATSGSDFLYISSSDDGSFMGNVGVGFIDGIALSSFADNNEVIGNNVAGAVITDAGTGNDLAHNK